MPEYLSTKCSRLDMAPEPGMYAGMTYEAASRLGQRYCEHAAVTGYWRYLPEHLLALRAVMLAGRPDSAWGGLPFGLALGPAE